MIAISAFLRKDWRRGSGSNRRIKVLQTSPLPLGYRALSGLTSALLNCRRSVPQAGLVWSGRPGSNRRHLPWQGSTLPLSYSRSSKIKYNGTVVYGQRGGPQRGSAALAGRLREIDGDTRAGGEVGAATGDVRSDKEKEIAGVHVGSVDGSGGLKSRQLADTG